MIDVVSPGQLTTIVSLPDWRRVSYGLPIGGAFDAEAATLANRAAGNDANANVLECVLVGPRLRFSQRTRVAWYGADCDVAAGAFEVEGELTIGRIRNGLRGWLAVEGGIEDERAPYAEAPTMLRKGTLGTGPLSPRRGERGRGEGLFPRTEPKTIGVKRGPHPSSLATIECEVTPQLDRVGIRLRPLLPLAEKPPADLPSCGMQFGSVQWHPDGSLVVMGPDAPITGGYLQPLTVIRAELWKLAQLGPGERVTLLAE